MILITGSSCIKQNENTIGSNLFVEFDATVQNTPLTGQIYPVLSRVPSYGVPVAGSNPSITRTSGSIKFRINLVGAQQSNDLPIGINVVANPAIPATATLAQKGVHFDVPAQVVIPAGSSFGEVPVTILDAGAGTGPVAFVLELTPVGNARPSNNYKYLGISIAQN